MQFSPSDQKIMQRAITLAKTPYCVLPNPRVGAVIVQNRKIIGEGFHHGPGQAHGEIEAIRNAEKKGIKNFRKAEIFITLEPCCHTKKRTPPCVPTLIKKKFKRVVVAQLDPNRAVSGKGIRKLRKAGLRVEVGCLSENAARLNQDYLKNQLQQIPYVTLKIATTFDGKMADDYGNSKWITSASSREEVHRRRAQADTIAVGKGTIDRDDPSLNVRLTKRSPIAKKILIFGKPERPLSKLKVAKVNGLQNIHVIKRGPIKKLLKKLYKNYGICHLFIEGGPKLASEFLAASAVDQFLLFQGKGLLGGIGTYSIGRAWRLKRLQKSIKFIPELVQKIGPDVFIQGFFHVYGLDSKSR